MRKQPGHVIHLPHSPPSSSIWQLLTLDVTALRGYDVTTKWEATWLGVFGNRFHTRCTSQWLARLWSMCDDLDICKTRLFRQQDWGRGKRSHGSKSSTFPSSCHISPSSALLCIPLQSSSHCRHECQQCETLTNCKGRSGRTVRNRKEDRGGWSCSVVNPHSHHPCDLFPRTQCR